MVKVTMDCYIPSEHTSIHIEGRNEKKVAKAYAYLLDFMTPKIIIKTVKRADKNEHLRQP